MATSPAEAAPVFLHSWWRTSSTYVWGKLRQIEHLCCYSEPLHETVGNLTLPIVRGRVDARIVANLNHPPMQRPYFAEYEPLLLEGGTRFTKALSYDRYLLYPQEADAELESYLRQLIESARQRGKRPLLACVRGSLRAAWMHRRFGGLQIALLRNPRDQWGSMLEQNSRGGAYFVAGVLAICGKLAGRVPGAFAHLPFRLVNYLGPNYNPLELGRYFAQVKELDADVGYGLFVLLWLASALQILSVADVVLDADQLSRSSQLRSRAEAQLSTHGLPVDFSDWATPSHPDLAQSPERLSEIEADAAQALGAGARPLVAVNPARIEGCCPDLDAASAQLLLRALDELRRSGLFERSSRDRSRSAEAQKGSPSAD
jgi:hypothetical protein